MAGEPFDAYLRDHVFRRAGMTSALTVDHNDQDVPGLGDGHVVAWEHAFAVDGPHTFEAGAGGVVASAADMAQWLIVQTNHGRAADGTPVVSGHSLAEQHTPGALTGMGTHWAGTPTDPLQHPPGSSTQAACSPTAPTWRSCPARGTASSSCSTQAQG